MTHAWLIAYIDASKVDSVIKDLRKRGIYRDITGYIPTVRILSKQIKNKQIFEYIPLLFNYGFFKIPMPLATDVNFLIKFKEDIQCLYGWVRDPARTLRTKPTIRKDKQSVFDTNNIPYAIASERDITNMIISEELNSIYSSKDLENLEIGKIITLRGYPFDNIQAEIISINTHKKEVKVKLLLEALIKQVTVSFDNIFYTVYRAFDADKEMREQSLDEIHERNPMGVGKIFADFILKSNE